MIGKAFEIPGEQHRITLLRGAVCEYLDEGLVNEFIQDLQLILESEKDAFLKKASHYEKTSNELLK